MNLGTKIRRILKQFFWHLLVAITKHELGTVQKQLVYSEHELQEAMQEADRHRAALNLLNRYSPEWTTAVGKRERRLADATHEVEDLTKAVEGMRRMKDRLTRGLQDLEAEKIA